MFRALRTDRGAASSWCRNARLSVRLKWSWSGCLARKFPRTAHQRTSKDPVGKPEQNGTERRLEMTARVCVCARACVRRPRWAPPQCNDRNLVEFKRDLCGKAI